MSFWSAERLSAEIPNGKLVSPFDPASIDSASYTLHVGGQAFVTHDKFANNAPGDPVVTVFGPPPHHTLRIPPGQFAFLLTKETVRVPNTAMALISIKAKYKFRGLINVSGFHVDPGWDGMLLFAVYNAGASEILLEDGQALFVIVYADLDRPTEKPYDGKAQFRKQIEVDIISPLTLQVFSPLMLQRQMSALQDQLRETEKTTGTVKAISYAATTFAVFLVAVLTLWVTAAPATLGAILVESIKAAGFELKRAPEGAPSAGQGAVPGSIGVQIQSPSASAVKPTAPSKN